MPQTQQKTQQKILIIKLGALGDFIQALGPMAAIRRHHPHAHITLLTSAPFQNFAKTSGYYDEIWLDERPKFLNFIGWKNFKNRLNKAEFSRIYDLQNNDRTGFYFWLLKGNPKPEWVGTAPGASHRNTSPERIAGHAFDGHVQTLALAGITDITIDTLTWMKENISSFPLKKPYVLMVPGSAPNRPEKRWQAEKYGRLAKILSQDGYQAVLLGTDAEKQAMQEIQNLCSESLDLSGQTSLPQIAALARSAAGAIGNDTGPMHLIAATGCPALTLFSQHSHPVKHAPKGAQVSILQKENLDDLSAEDVLKAFVPREKSTSNTATRH